MTLKDWGWNEKWANLFVPFQKEGLSPGRVDRPGRSSYRIVDAAGEREAVLTGRLRDNADRPAAGDWVAWREEGGTAIIVAVLPRRSVISRKVPGEETREQVIATNVDVAFLVQALDGGRGFTPRGLERYVTMAWESGCRPVAVLNKVDLSENPEADILTAESAAPGVEVVACSAATGEGIATLRDCLPPGKTGVFVGPSGVGKSSLINAMAGFDLSAVGAVREDDKRGRHTTTHRELHRIGDGRLLLDTPGLRELQLWGESEAADAAFPEIEELVTECRFRDCTHDGEPGCAVRRGLDDGSIAPDRFESWLDLRRELGWLEVRRDEKSRREYQEKWIKIAKFSRAIKKGKEVW